MRLYLQINDLPDFLSGKDQEQSLHIRVVHTHAKDVGKHGSRNNGSALTKPQFVATPCQQDNYEHSCSLEGKTAGFSREVLSNLLNICNLPQMKDMIKWL